MGSSLFCRHRFHTSVIQTAFWLIYRFTLSYRDVEEHLTERSTDVSFETIRHWCVKFGPIYARRMRRLSRKAIGPPRGEFASTRTSARTKAAAVQIGEIPSASFQRTPPL